MLHSYDLQPSVIKSTIMDISRLFYLQPPPPLLQKLFWQVEKLILACGKIILAGGKIILTGRTINLVGGKMILAGARGNNFRMLK